MKLDYETYADAVENFKWEERWEVFDKDREHLNVAHECVDRHPKGDIAIRLKHADGANEFYTFGQLSAWTSQFANMLGRAGLKQSDRVAVVLEPSIEYYVAFYGALKFGAVAVPCYPLLGPEGLGYRLESSEAKVVIIERQHIGNIPADLGAKVIPAEEFISDLAGESDTYETATSADSLAVIQFSSGTTGQPKQVLYKHGTVSVTAVYSRFWLGLRSGDVYMCLSSPAWGHGIWYGVVAPLISGNGIGAFSGGKFDAKVCLDAMEEWGVSVVSAIPRVFQMFLDVPGIDNYKLKWRELSYTGAEMPKELEEAYLKKFGIYIRSTYGNTESGPIAADFAFDDSEYRLGSCGRPVFGTRLAILDGAGNELPAGQHGQVAIWRHGSWRLIGDYGYLDNDGFLFPLGRSDDVIKSSGYRIGPFEIEAALERHESVAKAAVIGAPHEERGEIVKAFIVLNPGFAATDELKTELQTFVKARLSLHEYPKEIEFVDSVPETADGKLQRRKLKEQEYAKAGKTIV